MMRVTKDNADSSQRGRTARYGSHGCISRITSERHDGCDNHHNLTFRFGRMLRTDVAHVY